MAYNIKKILIGFNCLQRSKHFSGYIFRLFDTLLWFLFQKFLFFITRPSTTIHRGSFKALHYNFTVSFVLTSILNGREAITLKQQYVYDAGGWESFMLNGGLIDVILTVEMFLDSNRR